MEKLTDKDAFTTIRIIGKNSEIKHEFKVWANGGYEGFIEGLEDGEGTIMVNGIRPYIEHLQARIIYLHDELDRLKSSG